MRILGISAYYHDAAAALLDGDLLLAAAQEERFSRKKHDASFPAGAIRYCLDEAGLDLSDLDAIAYYEKPFLKFERLLETYYGFAPRGVGSFQAALPVWVKEKIMIRQNLRRALRALGRGEGPRVPILFPEHHLSHAASAFYPSPFEEAAVLTVDGVGEWATASISHGQGHRLTPLRELRFPHSLGLVYSAFTHFLGFRVNSGEYKLMGLAPFGNPDADRVRRFSELIRQNLLQIQPDGSLWTNPTFFTYATGLNMIPEKRWERLFGFPRRRPEEDIENHHGDLALAVQQVTEDVLRAMAREARRLTGSAHLCLAGGVALNCTAVGRLEAEGIFQRVWVQPAAGDAGGALGAALAARHIYFDQPRTVVPGDALRGAYLGPALGPSDVERVCRKHRAPVDRFPDELALARHVARLLAEGRVVGWVQGRMEWGPRALGNRSILGDPRNPEMQKKLNLSIKFREGFRPFAPAVLAEDSDRYFEGPSTSPYMSRVVPLRAEHRFPLSERFWDLPWRDKLHHPKSPIPAVTHIDYSARYQTVHRETNPRFWRLLACFKELTGLGVLVNTSFNVRGEPIVCTAEDAYRCFRRTRMDFLVMDLCLFDQVRQPPLDDKISSARFDSD